MSDVCNCIDVKVEVMIDEPDIQGEVDVSEVIFASDGQDYKRGYEEGHAQGLLDGQADGYDKGYNEGLADGTKEEQEKSIKITENGTTEITPDDNKVLSRVTVEVDVESKKGLDLISYANALTFDASVSEITEDIVLHCENFSNINNMFDLKTINAPKITVYISDKCTSFSRFMRRAGSVSNNEGLREVEIIGDTKNVTNFTQTFLSRHTLERIVGEVDFSGATNVSDMFSYCVSLRQFTPKANTIKASIAFAGSADLTDESIDAIVNGFADMTGQTAPVLTVHPTVKAKIEADDVKEDTDPTKHNWLRTLTSKNVTLA